MTQQSDPIFKLESTIKEKDAQIFDLKGRLPSLEKQLSEATILIDLSDNVLKQKDKGISELEVTVKQKEQSINDLHRAVKQKDKVISELEVTVKQKEQSINDLHSAVKQKNKVISELEVTAKQKEQSINDLHRAVKHKDNMVLLNARELEDKSHDILYLVTWLEKLDIASSTILRSHRWKIGNLIGGIFQLITLRRHVPKPEDYLTEIMEKFHNWKHNKD